VAANRGNLAIDRGDAVALVHGREVSAGTTRGTHCEQPRAYE